MMEISELVKEHKLTDEHGNTVLHLAVENKKFTQKGIIEVLKILLDSGADPNIKNKNGETILQLAVKNRRKDVIDYLLTRVTNVDSAVHFFINSECIKFKELSTKQNSDGWDNEINKIETESASFVEWLISKGFDFDFKNEKKQSALLMAIESNLQHILPALLKSTKDIDFLDETNRTLLHVFFEKKVRTRFSKRTNIDTNWYSNRYEVDIVKILLDRGISADAEDNSECTPIRLAIERKEDIAIIETLLERSTNLNRKNSEGETLIHVTIKQWTCSKDAETDYFMKIAQTLIAKGADINEQDKYGMTALGYAIERRNVCIAPSEEELEDHFKKKCRALVDANYNKPLSPKAVEKNNLDVVVYLEENGADFNVRTVENETLLHLFLKSSNHVKTSDDETEMKLFELLINKGCQVNAKDKAGNTPLHVAAMHSTIHFVRELIEYGVPVNCRNIEMETPLHYSTLNPKVQEVSDFLLRFGANVNAKNSKGQTSLHKVALEPRTKYSCAGLRMFLQYGADVNARDSENRTALSCARSRDLDVWQRKRQVWVHQENEAIFWDRDAARNKSNWYCYNDDDRSPNSPDPVVTIDDCPIEDVASDVVMTLTAHSIKLKAVGLPWDTEINSHLGDFYENCSIKKFLEFYHKECLIEVQKLKSTFIDSSMSLYDFIRATANSRRAYVNNDNLQQLIHSPKHDEQFPDYVGLILASYFEALYRRDLLEPAREAWLKLTKISLPAVCLDLIFSFLSNSDLFDIIEHE